jgi:hypothetical protein
MPPKKRSTVTTIPIKEHQIELPKEENLPAETQEEPPVPKPDVNCKSGLNLIYAVIFFVCLFAMLGYLGFYH